eukprot:5472686-Prorocentrum_lima.AAC.1
MIATKASPGQCAPPFVAQSAQTFSRSGVGREEAPHKPTGNSDTKVKRQACKKPPVADAYRAMAKWRR